MSHKIVEGRGGNARIGIIIIMILCSMIPCSRADEITQRIIGLFQPGRQDDLREIVKIMPDVQLVNLDYETTEATFRYDVAKLIPGFNPKKPPTPEAIAKRLDDLLRTASNGTFTLKPRAVIAKDKMQAIAIKVGVLDCKGCRYGAYLAIAKLDGVERATVTDAGLLTMWIDPAKTDRAALEAALKKARVELPTP